MTVLVPYDGSVLSKAALEKASEFGELTGNDLLVLTIIPDEDVEYAREHGWIEPGEPFHSELIAGNLEDEIKQIAPEAEFKWELTASDEPTATATMNVVRSIRRIAAEVEASVVFIGTENAGAVTVPLSSVGGSVANKRGGYDLYLVRTTEEA